MYEYAFVLLQGTLNGARPAGSSCFQETELSGCTWTCLLRVIAHLEVNNVPHA